MEIFPFIKVAWFALKKLLRMKQTFVVLTSILQEQSEFKVSFKNLSRFLFTQMPKGRSAFGELQSRT